MDKFIEKQNLPRLNHEKIENLNTPVISKETESVITLSQQRKTLDLVASLLKSTI